MADGMTVEFIGMDEFLREIRMLPESIRTRVLKGAVATGAAVMRKAAIAKAPIYLGGDSELMGMVGRKARKIQARHPPPGTLKKAIYQTRMTQLCNEGQEVWKVDVRRGKTAVSTRGANKGKRNIEQDAYYAMWVEYGHYTRTPSKARVQGNRKARQKMGMDFGSVRWVPAQPYMRPAFTSTREASIKAMGDYIDNHLNDAVSLMRYVRAVA